MSLQDTSEQNQIYRPLLQKSLNASQILEPTELDRYRHDVLRPQTSRRQWRIAGRIDLKIDCAVQSFFVECRRRRKELNWPTIDHDPQVGALGVSHISQGLFDWSKQNQT